MAVPSCVGAKGANPGIGFAHQSLALSGTAEKECCFMYVAIQPLVALIAGILILLVPRLLNYIVAIYLIVVGILGLFPAR